MDLQRQSQLASEIEAQIRRAVPVNQEGQPAEIQCSSCQQYLILDDVYTARSDASLICAACANTDKNRAIRSKSIVLMKQPGFYFLLIVAVALLFRMLGVGNPTVEDLKALDQGKKWEDQQNYGKLILNQGKRIHQRISYLEKIGRYDEINHWADLGADVNKHAADYWQGKEPEPYLRLGQYYLMAYEKPKDAWLKLKSLEDKLGNDSDSAKTYYYYRAKAALLADNKKLAVADLDKVLQLMNKGMADMIEQLEKDPFSQDPMIEQYLDRLTLKRVHLGAGSKLPDNLILYRTLALYEKFGLNSDIYRKSRKILKLDKKRKGIEIIEDDGSDFKIEN